MARNIIIMDSSASMRRIIRTMIQATINDAIVSEAYDAEEAMAMLEAGDYNLVLFSRESASKKWLEFAKRLLASTDQPPLSFILFSSSSKKEYLKEVSTYGITEHLSLPCTAEELGELITRICNPFTMRRARRYSAPGTVVFIEQGRKSYEAEVINMSGGGILCELSTPEHINWAAPGMLRLEIDIDGSSMSVAGLYSVPRRLIVVELNSDFTPRVVRVAWKFVNISEENKAKLEQVFSLLEKHGDMLYE